MLNYLSIDKEAIPYRFDMRLVGVTFTFEIHYNSEYDFFTVDLYRGEELLVAGEKLVYGRPLFNVYVNARLPDVIIVPFDLSGQQQGNGN